MKTHSRYFAPMAVLILTASQGLGLSSVGQERQQRYPDSQQPTPAPQLAQPVSSNILFSSDSDYRIGATDVLQITVQDAPELCNMVRVNASGVIPMGFLGQIKAVGKTPEELQKQIADGLRGDYLTDPQVSIVVVQYNSRSLFIQGAVKSPGVYIMEGRPSLLKLITMAGGLAENHGSTAFIIREIKRGKPDQETRARTVLTAPDNTEAAGRPSVESGASSSNHPTGGEAVQGSPTDEQEARYEMKQVNINSLLKGNFGQNQNIEPGDIVNIPQGDVFFVAGEVRSPGSFPLKDGTTLRQAISMAQGMTFRAKANIGVIFREDPATAKRQEIKVDISEVMAGKKEDLAILANDIIIVPNSRFRSVTQTLLNAFGANASRLTMP